jgi:hypothetical protein
MDSDAAPVSIRYDVTLDDLVAFNEFHWLRSGEAVRKRQKGAPVGALVVGIVYWLMLSMLSLMLQSTFGLWLSPVLALVVAAFVFWRMRRSTPKWPKWMQRRVRNMYSTGANKATLGEHVVKADNSGLFNTTAYSTTQFAWGALEKIETHGDYTYLYISAVQAIVVPHTRILEGDFAKFLMAVRAHYKADQKLIPSIPMSIEAANR